VFTLGGRAGPGGRATTAGGGGASVPSVPTYRISEAASLLGVSDDTVRRWADSGLLPTIREPGSRLAVDGAVLADFLVRRGASSAAAPTRRR